MTRSLIVTAAVLNATGAFAHAGHSAPASHTHWDLGVAALVIGVFAFIALRRKARAGRTK